MPAHELHHSPGFGSLLGTRMDILQSFGMVVALGVGSTYLTVMVLLPCGLRILPFRSKQKQLFNPIYSKESLVVSGLTRSAESPHCLCYGPRGIGASYVAIDYFVLKELPPDHPVTTANHLMNREFGGMSSVEINVSGEVQCLAPKDSRFWRRWKRYAVRSASNNPLNRLSR